VFERREVGDDADRWVWVFGGTEGGKEWQRLPGSVFGRSRNEKRGRGKEDGWAGWASR
jgi:hypothetical protein